ncbi:translation initiation factor Sui1 domain protein [Haemophilus pittmaniae HK 85]|uniref:Translation initiation factor Sui1 domain protein n=1 Tax=Haemophilus pittmaniae HK 85 TaxID=1035188 RepID=F9QBY8_9PAST|nr:translation initiation factor Sui1 domain protein [Haemophilus pittmaniae HK 85]
MSDSTLVYSTDVGRIKEPKRSLERPRGDGIVRIQKQTSGRKGAGVSVISGLDLADDEIKNLQLSLKNVVAVVVRLKMVILRSRVKNAIY